MKNILLATDFSENASNAIDYAIGLFGTSDVNYMLVNSFVELSSGSHVMMSMHDFLKKESEERLAEQESELLGKFGAENLNLECISKFGPVTEVIERIAEDRPVDFVVIGTKGASAFEDFFIGSNTLDIIRSVQLPLLVIPHGLHYSRIDKMVLAADLEHFNNEKLFTSMVNLAKKEESEILIVNVRTKEQTDHDHAEEGFELHNILEGIKHGFHTEVNENVVNGIEHFIRTHEADLLTMVARKHTFFERLFHKSVTKEVSMLGEVPVLVLHEQ